jgi:hypothetical protein
MSTIEAEIDLKREPGLEAQVHEPKAGMIVIKIVMAALAPLQMQFDLLGLRIAPNAKRLARLHGVQDADQALRDVIAGGNLASRLLFADGAGGNENKGPTGFLGQRFGLGFNSLSRAGHQSAKVLEQDVTDAQIRLHHPGAIQLTKRSPESQPVKSGKNSYDGRGIFSYKEVGSAVVVLSWCVHNPSLTTPQRRFLSFLSLGCPAYPCLSAFIRG